jgi:peroxiredoxin family protein
MTETPDKLSIIVYSGDFGRVHYAFSMAAAAVAVDRPATLFFTMEAIRALAKPLADGAPGWHALPGAAAQDAGFAECGVATFEELVSACAALGVRFLVCEMGLRAVGLTAADLRDDLAFAEGGIVTFLNDASADGAMLFI